MKDEGDILEMKLLVQEACEFYVFDGYNNCPQNNHINLYFFSTLLSILSSIKISECKKFLVKIAYYSVT